LIAIVTFFVVGAWALLFLAFGKLDALSLRQNKISEIDGFLIGT
jgi:hypothetical protein